MRWLIVLVAMLGVALAQRTDCFVNPRMNNPLNGQRMAFWAGVYAELELRCEKSIAIIDRIALGSSSTPQAITNAKRQVYQWLNQELRKLREEMARDKQEVEVRDKGGNTVRPIPPKDPATDPDP